MPRSSSSSKPILGRAMAILALPLTPISKAKGPIARNLLLFKKRGAAGKARRMLSSYGYKPHRHYNYDYVGEYQFSPSSSPLIAYPPGCRRDGGGAYGEGDQYEEEEEEEDDDEGVDGRAERFIERFYEEMRLQRQRSLVQRLL
uniref:Uncharacterized protein n=1 Tax=Oryza barthii TaxID=65489 RepID=A0A0D3EJA2_9ORYZ